MALKITPVLAVEAEMLSSQLRAQVLRLAHWLKPYLPALDGRFLAHLRKRGYDPKQRKALAAITPQAAAGLLSRRRPLADFFEQVNYSGRRLAKLDVPPGRILEELEESGRLVASVLGRAGPREAANFDWVRQQLQACVVLTLNNAFYRVREAETDAFYALFQAELESRSQTELLKRFLAILAGFCQAEAGRLFLLDRQVSAWLAAASLTEQSALPPVENSPAVQRKLSHPRYIRRGSRAEALLLDPGWRGLYESCWSIPLLRGWRVEGVIQFGFRKTYEWLPRELQLLGVAAERLLQASEKARLVEEVRGREQQIRHLAAHMLHVEEAERQRISRELHDEAGQSLLCLRLQLELLERKLPGSLSQLRSGLAEARELLERTIVDVRRLIADLSPAVLEHLGLPAALRQLVSRFRRLHPIRVRLQVARLGVLPMKMQRVVYRLVQECCNNTGRHSSASRLNISLSTVDNVLRLRVEDDGVGFDVEQALAGRNTFGLAGMRERVALLGGRLEIHSRPGQGAKILIELPIAVQDCVVGGAGLRHAG